MQKMTHQTPLLSSLKIRTKASSYVPDHVADELVDNLIKFLDKFEEENTPVQVLIDMKEPSPHQHSHR